MVFTPLRREEFQYRNPIRERAPVKPTSPEDEPKAESFDERADRIMREAAEKVSSTWAGLRSRLSSLGDRFMKAAKTGVSASAAGLEAGGALVKGTAGGAWEVAKSTPMITKGVAEHFREEGAGLLGGLHDMIRPHEAPDADKITEVEMIMESVHDMIMSTAPGKSRDTLIQTYERFAKDRDALLNTPRSTRGVKAVAEGGRWVGGKIEEIQEARRREQEARRVAHEEACIARAELFLIDVVDATEAELPALTREQLVTLGTTLETSLAHRIAGGVKEVGKAVFFVDDVIDTGRNLASGALDFASFVRNPNDRAWLVNELRDANIKIGEALEEAAGTVAKKVVLEPVKRGGRAVGRAGKEAMIVQWQEHGPAITQGLASTVESLVTITKNALGVPDAVFRTADDVSRKMNDQAKQATGFFGRMKTTVDNAVVIAKHKWNEFMFEVAQETTQNKNPELVAQIHDAVVALEAVEKTQVTGALSNERSYSTRRRNNSTIVDNRERNRIRRTKKAA